MAIKVGDNAPDFTLKDQNGDEVTLTALQGKNVLLSFHPLAWTKICGQQMKSLEDNLLRFQEKKTVAFGVSVDSVPSKKAWAERDLGIIKTSLLSDFWPHGGIAQRFGIFREQDGFSQRANIIIDTQGRVSFVKIYDISQLPDIEEILNKIKN
ncbi:MAG: peroxiredoxin [candidate division WOR-3 bacterium]|nr:MAG: peroxiredoxin [candidate division WOR-3 bacterium]